MSVTFIREPIEPVTPPKPVLKRVMLDITPTQAKIIRALLGGMQSGCAASRECQPIYTALTKEFGFLGLNASKPGYVVDMPEDD